MEASQATRHRLFIALCQGNLSILHQIVQMHASPLDGELQDGKDSVSLIPGTWHSVQSSADTQ